jgi:hypothetical protein
MQPEENLADHLLLIFVEELGDAFVGDLPVVIDLRAKRVVKIEADDLALLFGFASSVPASKRLPGRPLKAAAPARAALDFRN